MSLLDATQGDIKCDVDESLWPDRRDCQDVHQEHETYNLYNLLFAEVHFVANIRFTVYDFT